jgi:D-glycero-D-manno-heptose 1,7-bisphosphate phosphatase
MAHWRKPGPGMLEHAAELLNLDLGRSWLIGDTESDITAARVAGLAGAIHVSAARDDARVGAMPFKVYPVAELGDAIKVLRPQFA